VELRVLKKTLVLTQNSTLSLHPPIHRYRRGYTLAGVLYFHQISDFEMGGISPRNFRMFKRLCGESTLRNIVIVTNMWGEVDPQVGEAREAKLKDTFFKPVLDKGAQIARNENTVTSAQRIIRLILNDCFLEEPEAVYAEEEPRVVCAEEPEVMYAEECEVMYEDDIVSFGGSEGTCAEGEPEYEAMYEVESMTDTNRLASDYRDERARLEARLAQMEAEANAERVAA